MTRRRLPTGIQTFRELRERDCYYVDKTGYILRLVDEGKHYFLLFEGSEPLFAGLAIHGHWDWSVRRPVLRLSFGSGTFRTEGDLPAEVADQLEAIEKAAGIAPRPGAAAARFRALIRALHERAGRRVVVLVDEYDKPILDTLEVSEVARANRDFLRGLYAVVKDRDAHVRFTFLTGVSKFSKVSLFSGLNNLTDITLDPRCSALCGYTDADLDTLDRREFDAWWFETGTPAFLVDTLTARRVGALCSREHGRQWRPPVVVRRRRHRDRSAAVPDRLSDDHGLGRPGREDALSARLSEPGGTPEPERAPAAQHDPPTRRTRERARCSSIGCCAPTTSPD